MQHHVESPQDGPEEGRRTRLSFNVTPRVREQLERLQVESGAESLTEVLRKALATYDALNDVRRDGGKVVLEYQDGRETLSLKVI